MPRTGNALKDSIISLGISEGNFELIERISQQADDLFERTREIIHTGEVANMCFFIIPKEGDILIFMPDICLIGLRDLDPENQKDAIANALRQVLSDNPAIAVIQVSESYYLENKSKEKLEAAMESGLSNDPESIEVAIATICINVRGQQKLLIKSCKIIGEEGSPRETVVREDWKVMSGLGRFAVEAAYLSPLT